MSHARRLSVLAIASALSLPAHAEYQFDRIGEYDAFVDGVLQTDYNRFDDDLKDFVDDAEFPLVLRRQDWGTETFALTRIV